MRPLLTPAEALQQLVLPGLQHATAKYTPHTPPPPLPTSDSAPNTPRRTTTSPQAAPSGRRPGADLMLVLELGIACLGGGRGMGAWAAGVPGGGSTMGGAQMDEVGGQMVQQGVAAEMLLQLCTLLDARPQCGGAQEGLRHRHARGLGGVAASKGEGATRANGLPMAAVAPAVRLAELVCAAAAAHCDQLAAQGDRVAGLPQTDLGRGSGAPGTERGQDFRGHDAELAGLESLLRTLASAAVSFSWRSRLVLAPLAAAEAALAARAPPPSTTLRWRGGASLTTTLQVSSLGRGRDGVPAAPRGKPCTGGDALEAVMDALTLCMAGESVAAAFASSCCVGGPAEFKPEVGRPVPLRCRLQELLVCA